jgi:hypothetical protein
MANLNIVSVASILAGTTASLPANTTAFYIITNAASSGTVVKVNNVVISNTSNSAAFANVFFNSAAIGAGTNIPVIQSVSVPANASLIAIDKSTSIYLTENTSLVVQSATSNALAFSTSFETLS